jgi:hypothetical protein
MHNIFSSWMNSANIERMKNSMMNVSPFYWTRNHVYCLLCGTGWSTKFTASKIEHSFSWPFPMFQFTTNTSFVFDNQLQSLLTNEVRGHSEKYHLLLLHTHLLHETKPYDVGTSDFLTFSESKLNWSLNLPLHISWEVKTISWVKGCTCVGSLKTLTCSNLIVELYLL